MEDDLIEAISHVLANDLIVDILLRLPAKSIARFRCVSKSWFSITTCPSFLLNHTQRSPIFILIQTIRLQSNVFDLSSFNLQLLPPSVNVVLPERRRRTDDEVVASCDGLLCLLKHAGVDNFDDAIHSYYILNPLTGAQLDIPNPTNPSGRLFGFYFHPSTCEYHLIRRKYFNFNFEIELISLGGEAWRTIDCSSCGGLECRGTQIDLNGTLYWIAYNADEHQASSIMGFDIVEERFSLMPLPPEDIYIFANGNLFDMEKRLGFSAINVELSSLNGMMIDIWVMKDFDNVEWEKIYSLSFFGGFGIDFRSSPLVCIWKKKFIFLLDSLDLYLVESDLNSMDYYAVQVNTRGSYLWDYSILYKESLISYDSFIIK